MSWFTGAAKQANMEGTNRSITGRGPGLTRDQWVHLRMGLETLLRGPVLETLSHGGEGSRRRDKADEQSQRDTRFARGETRTKGEVEAWAMVWW